MQCSTVTASSLQLCPMFSRINWCNSKTTHILHVARICRLKILIPLNGYQTCTVQIYCPLSISGIKLISTFAVISKLPTILSGRLRPSLRNGTDFHSIQENMWRNVNMRRTYLLLISSFHELRYHTNLAQIFIPIKWFFVYSFLKINFKEIGVIIMYKKSRTYYIINTL